MRENQESMFGNGMGRDKANISLTLFMDASCNNQMDGTVLIMVYIA